MHHALCKHDTSSSSAIKLIQNQQRCTKNQKSNLQLHIIFYARKCRNPLLSSLIHESKCKKVETYNFISFFHARDARNVRHHVFKQGNRKETQLKMNSKFQLFPNFSAIISSPSKQHENCLFSFDCSHNVPQL